MTTAHNADQIAFWNGPAADRWIKYRQVSDARLAPVTHALTRFAAAKEGESVLDIGCGCGETTLLLARTVGPAGRVLGIDISEPMLGVARSLAESTGLKADFLQADAATHRFDGAFDLVFSRFGVMFFDDPAAAFANIRTALRPGGRLAFACWRTPAENPCFMVPLEVTRDLLPPLEPPDPLAPGPFAFADRERMERILSSAGFTDVRHERFDVQISLGSTLEQAIEMSLNFGALARVLHDVDARTLEAVRERLAVELKKLEGPRGIALPGAGWLVGAQRPR